MSAYKTVASRELVKKTINGEPTMRIAKGELCISEDVICHNYGCKQSGFTEKYTFIRKLKQDIVSLSPLYPPNPKSLPAHHECLMPEITRWANETPLFTFAVLDGAFEWGMRIFGVERFLVMLRKTPSALGEFIREVEKLNLSMAEEMEANGIDGILLADDIAYQQGLFVVPTVLRDIFIPSLARQVYKISSYDLPVFFHSDGDYRDVLQDIVNCGFSGLQCLEKKAGMDIAELQKRYNNTLCLWGHLEVEDIAQASTAGQCATIVEKIKKLASSQRFILGTTSGIFSGIDIDQLQKIYDTL